MVTSGLFSVFVLLFWSQSCDVEGGSHSGDTQPTPPRNPGVNAASEEAFNDGRKIVLKLPSYTSAPLSADDVTLNSHRSTCTNPAHI